MPEKPSNPLLQGRVTGKNPVEALFGRREGDPELRVGPRGMLRLSNAARDRPAQIHFGVRGEASTRFSNERVVFAESLQPLLLVPGNDMRRHSSVTHCDGNLPVELVQEIPELCISFPGLEPGGEKRERKDHIMKDQPLIGVFLAAGLHGLTIGDQEGVEKPSDKLTLGQTLLDVQRFPNAPRRSP